MNKLLPIGKVSKSFGLDGGVMVNLYDTFHGNLNNEEPLFVRIDGLAVPLFADYFERRGKSGALIRFDDIDTPQRASELLGKELFTRQEPGRTDLRRGDELETADGIEVSDDTEDDKELFLDELVGYTAMVAEAGAEVNPFKGKVIAFIDDVFNPLLQLEIAGKDVFIPAADEFIDEIDTVSKEISFTVPMGLLELYL